MCYRTGRVTESAITSRVAGGAIPMCYSTGHVARRDIPMCYSTSHVAGGAIPMYYSTGRAPWFSAIAMCGGDWVLLLLLLAIAHSTENSTKVL